MKIPLYLIRWSLVVSLEKLALFLAVQGLPLSGTKTVCSLTSSTLITEVFCVVNSLRAIFPIYYYSVVQNSAAFLKISVPTKKVKIFNPFMTEAVIIANQWTGFCMITASDMKGLLGQFLSSYFPGILWGIFKDFCIFIYCFKASIDVLRVLLNFCDGVFLRKLLAAKNTCCYYLCGIPRIE